MSTKIFRSAGLVAALAMAGVPVVTQAATTQTHSPTNLTYQTSMETLPGPSAPWTGSLHLTIDPDGIIRGWYHPADDMAAFIPVNGGLQGDRVWLDIGRQGNLHVSGTMKDREITGGGIDAQNNQMFSFEAKA